MKVYYICTYVLTTISVSKHNPEVDPFTLDDLTVTITGGTGATVKTTGTVAFWNQT